MTIGAELGQYFVHIQKNSKASMGELNSPNSPTPGYATVRDIPKKNYPVTPPVNYFAAGMFLPFIRTLGGWCQQNCDRNQKFTYTTLYAYK